MDKKFLFQNSNGFSMVQVLIASAMVAGLALTMAKLSETNKSMQRGIVASMDEQSLRKQIEAIMNHRASCTATVRCSEIPPGDSVTIPSIRTHYGSNPTDRFSANDNIGAVTLDNILLTRTNDQVILEVDVSKSGNGFGGKNKRIRVPLEVAFATDEAGAQTNIVHSCTTSNQNTSTVSGQWLCGDEDAPGYGEEEYQMLKLSLQNGYDPCMTLFSHDPNSSNRPDYECSELGDGKYQIVKACETFVYEVIEEEVVTDANGNVIHVNTEHPFTVNSENKLDIVQVTLTGGGGGGGSSSSALSGEHGQMGEVKRVNINVTPGSQCYIYLGAGGAGGNSSEQLQIFPNPENVALIKDADGDKVISIYDANDNNPTITTIVNANPNIPTLDVNGNGVADFADFDYLMVAYSRDPYYKTSPNFFRDEDGDKVISFFDEDDDNINAKCILNYNADASCQPIGGVPDLDANANGIPDFADLDYLVNDTSMSNYKAFLSNVDSFKVGPENFPNPKMGHLWQMPQCPPNQSCLPVRKTNYDSVNTSSSVPTIDINGNGVPDYEDWKILGSDASYTSKAQLTSNPSLIFDKDGDNVIHIYDKDDNDIDITEIYNNGLNNNHPIVDINGNGVPDFADAAFLAGDPSNAYQISPQITASPHLIKDEDGDGVISIYDANDSDPENKNITGINPNFTVFQQVNDVNGNGIPDFADFNYLTENYFKTLDGQPGEDSYITCDYSTTIVARGGRGGKSAVIDAENGESFPDMNRASNPGKFSITSGIDLDGGEGGTPLDTPGKNSEINLGGGGAARAAIGGSVGGNGGRGSVYIKWAKIDRSFNQQEETGTTNQGFALCSINTCSNVNVPDCGTDGGSGDTGTTSTDGTDGRPNEDDEIGTSTTGGSDTGTTGGSGTTGSTGGAGTGGGGWDGVDEATNEK